MKWSCRGPADPREPRAPWSRRGPMSSTGDGAGILIQLPTVLPRGPAWTCRQPASTVAMCFLPRENEGAGKNSRP